MTTLSITIGVLLFISSASNGIMDKLMFHYTTSIFKNLNPSFWNPSVSWKNKWKNGNKSEGERFLGSSTIFVSLTDAWHLFKSIMMNSIRISVVIIFLQLFNIEGVKINIIFAAIFYIVLFTIQSFGFHLFYTLIKNKNENRL